MSGSRLPAAQLAKQQSSVPFILPECPCVSHSCQGCVHFQVLADGTLGITKIEAHQRCALLSWVAVKQFIGGLAPCNGKAEWGKTSAG